MRIYTLIAYKPNEYNSYETEIFDSVLNIYTELTIEELEECLIDIFYKDIYKSVYDKSYIINILENNIHVYENNKNISKSFILDEVIDNAKKAAKHKGR